jgi:hypothetical protein
LFLSLPYFIILVKFLNYNPDYNTYKLVLWKIHYFTILESIINKFNNLTDDNVEVKQLTYQTQISIKKALDIESYIGCVSSVFINETNVFKSGKINLRFKRVSNYSKFI